MNNRPFFRHGKLNRHGHKAAKMFLRKHQGEGGLLPAVRMYMEQAIKVLS